ncbi:MAG: hypothetical protein J0I64_07065, partial [Devosia sp.]|nr:hypothetical protein [Devosia sp.]
PEAAPLELAEVEMDVGCVLSPLAKYGAFGTRICRPQALALLEQDYLRGFAQPGRRRPDVGPGAILKAG